MKKAISIFLILTFFSSPGYALAPSLVSDSTINPIRSAQLQGDIAAKLEPGAIGNGAPLTELAQGKLPPKASLTDNEYQEITQKLLKAIGLAIKLSIINESQVPSQHQARAKQALGNLIILQNNLSKDAYLYNADIRGSEDYLLGFNFQDYRGFALEVVKGLYDISPLHLAQYVYHECVPEGGVITERDDHRAVYNEIQSAIFGQNEVVALKKDLRRFINERTATGLTAQAAVRKPPIDMTKMARLKRWYSAFKYAKRFKVHYYGPSERDIRKFLSRFDIQEQSELFELANNSKLNISALLGSLIESSTDFDEIKNDLEFCIKIGGNGRTVKDILEVRHNIPDVELQEIWLDLALQLASKGIHNTTDVIAEGLAIVKVCKTSQELRAVVKLINETVQKLIDERNVLTKEPQCDSSGGSAIEKFLVKTLAISKNSADLAVNLKYLEVIAARLLKEPEKISGERETGGFRMTRSEVDKLILEARRFNMSGQGFDIAIERATGGGSVSYDVIAVTMDGSWTYEGTSEAEEPGEPQSIRIVEGNIWVTERSIEGLSASDTETKTAALITERGKTQISEELPVRAKLFTANLTQVLTQHQDQLFFIGIETDIGESQKTQIMPIYKAIDEIKEMKNAEGKPLFPNLMVKRGKAADLVAEVASLKTDGKLALNNTFVGARKLSVDDRLYDSIKGEGKAWIAAIDDSRQSDYLPVFESVTLNMMAYLNADQSAIKILYDAISEKPIDPAALQDMIRNRIIYILPRATKFDIKQLRDLYELAQQLHTAA